MIENFETNDLVVNHLGQNTGIPLQNTLILITGINDKDVNPPPPV